MNKNQIVWHDFSNEDSKRLYHSQWANEPEVKTLYEDGFQCGGCSFFASFDADYGLCCHSESRHHLETVFEHFTCPKYVHEGWGPHSFTETEWLHCICVPRPPKNPMGGEESTE